MGAAKSKRRPKPVRFPLRSTLRYDAAFAEPVAEMRRAIARRRGVDLGKVDFSTAVRALMGDRYEAASLLASQPEAWHAAGAVELPPELWDALTECGNRLSHSQGSLYNISRKLNFGETISVDEARAAFQAVQASKQAVTRMEQHLVAFVTGASDAAGAKSAAGRG